MRGANAHVQNIEGNVFLNVRGKIVFQHTKKRATIPGTMSRLVNNNTFTVLTEIPQRREIIVEIATFSLKGFISTKTTYYGE